MTKNLKSFKKTVSFSIIAPLFLLLLITSIVFYLIYKQDQTENQETEKRQILSTNRLFQSGISEKLAIIASSNIFIDFTTSGDLTRKEIMPKFLEQLSILHENGMIGLTLIDIERKTLFDYGKNSNQNITLKLCYLANRLDSKYGNCGYLLRLYFSKDVVVNALTKINDKLSVCNNCKSINLFNEDRFGSFEIQSKSPFLVKLMLQDEHGNIFYYYFLVIAVLVIFAISNSIHIHKIINKIIANPLQHLVKNIQNNAILEQSNESLSEINYLIDQIDLWKGELEKNQKMEKQAAIGKLTAQLVHDMRSPLAVMEITVKSLVSKISESSYGMLREAIQSAQNIANNFLEHYRQENSIIGESEQDDGNIARPILLTNIVSLIVSQKTQEWKYNSCNLLANISLSSNSAWIYASPVDIKRTLSNLLNNAYEALDKNREIHLNLSNTCNNTLQLQIRDNGHGIPEDKISVVLNGISLKHSGSGLGLSSAKRFMEKLGGRLQLSSIHGRGTEITLLFPAAPDPIWFPKAIMLPKTTFVIVLDDDPSMHNLWRDRLQSHGVNSQHFLHSKNILKWYDDHADAHDGAVYLIDYELRNDNFNGLEILQQFNAKDRGYLITSHAEEILIQQRCEQFGVWLIPKSLVWEIVLKG